VAEHGAAHDIRARRPERVETESCRGRDDRSGRDAR
jgi:hypothetical protein